MTDLALSALAPLPLLAASLPFLGRPGRRPGALPRLAEGATLAALALAAGGLVQLLMTGPQVLHLGGAALIRLDAVSVTMALLVAFVGWVVTRYARRYLDGEAREGAFHALTLAAVAAVLVMVQAAGLPVMITAFVATGLILRQLLLFYPERAEARRAAAKFIRVWGAGDLALIAAAVLFWHGLGTLDLAALNGAAALPLSAQLGIGLVVLAAALKCAAFPAHGWLTEVMEAPTPVSALLHAGIINSGGVLLIALAGLVQASPGAMAALVMIGGFTALFGALVMLTQSAVKTALAWSTVAQMGFMLLQCGLGAFSSALLHILAHSLYKAHAFLWSGSAAERAPAATSLTGGLRPTIVLASFGLAAVIFMTVAAIFTAVSWEKPAMAVLGTVLVLGMGQALATGLAAGGGVQLLTRLVATMVAISVVYVALQTAMAWFLQGTVHAAPSPSPVITAIAILTLTSFAGLSLIQAMGLHARPPSWLRALHVHAGNGFYANALFNRMAGALHIRNTNSEGSRS